MVDDEINPVEESSEVNQNQNPNPEGKELELNEALTTRVTELEDLLAQKDKELELANARISELEQEIAESKTALDDLNQLYSEAISSYRNLIIQANPDVPDELFSVKLLGLYPGFEYLF